MSTGISRDEWLAALGESLTPPDPSALTSQELADLFGCGTTSIKDRIRKLVREQKVVRVCKVVMDASGRRVRVPAYKLVRDAPRPATRKR